MLVFVIAYYAEETLTPVAGGVFGGFMGGIGGLSFPLSLVLAIKALSLPFLFPVFLAAGVGGAWGIARTVFGGIYRQRSAELETLADRLQIHATETIQAAGRGRLKR